MSGLLDDFISEARELVESISEGLLELEKTPDDADVLNGLFRAMHTLKGASGIFDIAPFTRTVHAAEDLLDAVRDGRVTPTPELVDVLFDTLDQVSEWIDDLQSGETLPDGAATAARSLSGRLRGLLGEEEDAGEESAGPSADAGGDGPSGPPPVEWLTRIPEPVRLDIFRRLVPENGSVIAVEYTPDEGCFFTGDDPFFTIRQAPDTLWRGVAPRQSWPEAADDFDPYQCNLRFDLLVGSEPEPVRDLLRYVEDQSRVTPFPALALAVPAGETGDDDGPALPAEARELAEREDWPALAELVRPALDEARPDSLRASALRWLDASLSLPTPPAPVVDHLLRTLETGTPPESAPLAEPAGKAPADDEAATGTAPATEAAPSAVEEAGAALLADMARGLALPVPDEIRDGFLAATVGGLRNLLPALGFEDAAARLDEVADETARERAFAPLRALVEEALGRLAPDAAGAGAEQPKAPGAAGQTEERPASAESSASRETARAPVLKVEQGRVDALMDLAGELVVAKNGLPFLARRAEEVFGSRELAREIKAQYEVINRIADDLQHAVMQIRMVPVEVVFKRFNRLVRDLSRKLDKKIRLVIEGEETEIDKNIVEDLTDPLVHLLRNSLDHGIESPDERVAAGKPPEGEIRLSAVSLDDQVLIEVADDGRGIDPDVIRRKAYEKGLIDEERLETVGDREALQYIMMPGFSTAEQISELSGRGVGMDVVRTMVERCGGSITIDSEKGRGTSVKVYLPLSMAVSRVMIVDVGDLSLGVPIDSIVETVRVPLDQIHRIRDRETIVLRDRIVPLCRLAHVLDIGGSEEADSAEDVAVLVVKTVGGELGLVVDRFHAGVDIILKPLDGVLSGFRLYSGTALLGDGSVLLVLNLRELVKWH